MIRKLFAIQNVIDWHTISRVSLGNSTISSTDKPDHYLSIPRQRLIRLRVDDALRLLPNVKVGTDLSNAVVLRAVPSLETSTSDTLGSFPGYCEEGALVAGLFDSFRAWASRVTFPPAARTKDGYNGEQPERE